MIPEEDLAHARTLVATLKSHARAPIRSVLARFMADMELGRAEANALDLAGFAAQVQPRVYILLPGVVEAFCEVFDRPAPALVEYREFPGKGSNRAEKAALFASISAPAPQTRTVTLCERLIDVAISQGTVLPDPPAAPAEVHCSPEPVAVPAAPVACLCEGDRGAVEGVCAEPGCAVEAPAVPADPCPLRTHWTGTQVIPGENPIGEIVRKLRRSHV